MPESRERTDEGRADAAEASTPSPAELDELVRTLLINVTEFDLLNSLHIHGNMFRLYRTGTSLTNSELTDIVTMGQGERAVLELYDTVSFPPGVCRAFRNIGDDEGILIARRFRDMVAAIAREQGARRYPGSWRVAGAEADELRW